MGESQNDPRDKIAGARDEIELTDAQRVELTDSQRLREEIIFSALSVFLSPLPYLSAGFNELRQHKARREMERLSIFAQELKEQMEKVSEDSVNWGYLRSDEFQDSFLKAMETAMRTRDREKIALVAQILRGAVVSFRPEDLSAAEEYLYLVSDLTPQELRVAVSVYTLHPTASGGAETSSAAWREWAQSASRDVGLDIPDLRFALGRLVSAGLLDRITTFGEGDIVFTEMERGEVGVYRITPAFEKLMELVKHEAEEN